MRRQSLVLPLAGLVATLLLGGHASTQESACVYDAAQVQIGPLQPALEAIFDLDGNPHPDAVGALFGSGSSVLGIYHNDGTGHFRSVWSTTATGSFGDSFVRAGDFDGDGRRDDFVHLVGGNLQFFFCDGVGAPTVIGAPIASPVPNIFDVEVTDLDNDGRDDLLVAAYSNAPPFPFGALIQVLSRGSGVPPAITTPMIEPALVVRRCCSARLADGSHLVLVLDANTSTVKPVRIDPTATQATFPPSFTVATGLTDPTAGDIDNDGDVDFVLFGMPNSAGAFQVLRQQGGSFTVENLEVGGPATGLADIDGDGDLDGICCGGGGGGSPPVPNHRVSNFELSINDGTGHFTPSFVIAGMGARHIAGAVDVDGDGDVDLVAGRVVYFAQGPLARSPFRRAVDGWFGGEFDLEGPRDADGDGDLDVGGSPTGSHLNDGRGDLLESPSTSPIDVQFVSGMVSADLDGDGDLDALVTVGSFPTPPIAAGTWRVFQDRPGQWVIDRRVLPPQTSALSPDALTHTFVRDLDGDGGHDVVVTSDLDPGTGMTSDFTSIYRETANGTLILVGNSSFTVKAIVDLDGDSLPDLVVARRSVGFGTCRNRGAGTFDPPVFVVNTATDSFHDRLAVADLDGDGDLDLAAPEAFSAGNPTSTVVVASNDGSGNFQAQPRQASFPDFGTTSWHLVRAADVDGDGRIDLLVYPGHETAYGTSVLRNDGLGQFVDAGTQVFNPQFPADFDGDGAADVLQLSGRTIIASRCHAGAVHGAFEQRGDGGPGLGSARLRLGAAGPFRAGHDMQLRILGGRGGAVGGLVIGLSGTFVPDLFGPEQDLHIDPSAPTFAVPFQLGGSPGTAGTGSLRIPVLVPAAMVGVELHHQVGLLDANAPLGLVTSNGLWIRYGN